MSDQLRKVREAYEGPMRQVGINDAKRNVIHRVAATALSTGADIKAQLEQDELLRFELFAKNVSIGHLCALIDELSPLADRYTYLRERDTMEKGGVFAGKTPDNVVLNGEDLDAAIDAARAAAAHHDPA